MLRLLGCGFSLDDFGTGYSSLSHLHDLPLTKIKIDRSFVADLSRSPTSLKIVKSLLALSRDMGLECVVEGVETEEEMAALKRLGGLIVQGYYYSPPIPANKVASLISQFEDSPRHGATLANIPETLH
jgi:predicted signal transduction protein with EAL and GGDEF domain